MPGDLHDASEMRLQLAEPPAILPREGALAGISEKRQSAGSVSVREADGSPPGQVPAGAPRTATISAITDSLVYEVTKSQMEELFVRGGPDVADTLSRVVAERRLRNDAAYVAATRAEQEQQKAALAEQILVSIKGFFGDAFHRIESRFTQAMAGK
jgi:CRP-like cAMP-binding protein